ncbi:MAG: substrate-binding domain-containing protein [Chitinophagaceae bacterium]
MIITQSQESSDKELMNIETLMYRSVDGMLVSLSSDTGNGVHLKEIHHGGTPVVYFDRVSDTFETHKVISDNSTRSYNLTQHLIENGFKRIAHITGNELP